MEFDSKERTSNAPFAVDDDALRPSEARSELAAEAVGALVEPQPPPTESAFSTDELPSLFNTTIDASIDDTLYDQQSRIVLLLPASQQPPHQQAASRPPSYRTLERKSKPTLLSGVQALHTVSKPKDDSPSAFELKLSSLVNDQSGVVAVDRIKPLIELLKEEQNSLEHQSLVWSALLLTKSLQCRRSFVELGGTVLLNESLARAKRDSKTPFLRQLLKVLECLPMSVDALRASTIGKAVKALRSHADAEVAQRADRLMTAWMELIAVGTKADADANASKPPTSTPTLTPSSTTAASTATAAAAAAATSTTDSSKRTRCVSCSRFFWLLLVEDLFGCLMIAKRSNHTNLKSTIER